MAETKTPLVEFIEDLMSILDEAQIEWLTKNKGYYIFKDNQQRKELSARLYRRKTR